MQILMELDCNAQQGSSDWQEGRDLLPSISPPAWCCGCDVLRDGDAGLVVTAAALGSRMTGGFH